MKILKQRLIVLSILILIAGQGLAQTWEYLSFIGGPNNDLDPVITTDFNGNLLVAGSFASPALNLGSTLLTNSGNTDVFLVKYDKAGNVLWSRSASGSNYDGARSVCTDASGNIFVSGYFRSPNISFGPIQLTNSNAVTYNGDAFLVKCDSMGNLLWAKNLGAKKILASKCNAAGDVFVSGSDLALSGGGAFFYGKYSGANGNYIWGNSGVYDGIGDGTAIVIEQNDDIYVAGNSLGGLDALLPSLQTQGGFDAFLIKFSASGNPLWGKMLGGSGAEHAFSLVLNNSGELIISGDFNSSLVDMGVDSLILPNLGSTSNFVAKFDTLGTEVWSRLIGNTYALGGSWATCDAADNIYVIGDYKPDSLSIPPFHLTNSSPTTNEVYIASFNTSGSIQWLKGIEGTSDDMAMNITVDPFGNIYFAGNTWSPLMTLDSLTLNTHATSTTRDIFIIKLGSVINGLSSLQSTELLSAYPNPSTGIFHLSLPAQYFGMVCDVYDLSGQKISSFRYEKDAIVNLSYLTSGMYFIKSTDASLKGIKLILNKD